MKKIIIIIIIIIINTSFSKSLSVIIWGKNEHTKSIEKMVSSIPFLQLEAIQSYNNLSLIEEFYLKYKFRGKIIISSLMGERREKDFYKQLNFCRKNNIRFSHPTALLPYLSTSHLGSYKIKRHGFPGSGNILLDSFLNFLLRENKGKRKLTPSFNAYVSFDYDLKIMKVLENGASNSLIIPVSAYLRSITVDNSFVINGVPMGGVMENGEIILSDHITPYKSDIDLFKRKGFKQIVIVRNPINVFCSLLRKNYKMNREFYAKALGYFYKEVQQNKDELIIVRYEDILNDPFRALYKVSRKLGFFIEKNKLENWIVQHLKKNLIKKKIHYKIAQTLYENEQLTKVELDLLKKYNLIQLGKHFGYEIDVTKISMIPHKKVEEETIWRDAYVVFPLENTLLKSTLFFTRKRRPLFVYDLQHVKTFCPGGEKENIINKIYSLIDLFYLDSAIIDESTACYYRRQGT